MAGPCVLSSLVVAIANYLQDFHRICSAWLKVATALSWRLYGRQRMRINSSSQPDDRKDTYTRVGTTSKCAKLASFASFARTSGSRNDVVSLSAGPADSQRLFAARRWRGGR